MKKVIILVLFIAVITNCSDKQKDYKLIVHSNQLNKILKNQYLNNNPLDDTLFLDSHKVIKYFPDSFFYYDDFDSLLDDGMGENFGLSDMLSAFKEPVLFNIRNNKTCFRFTMFRSFHSPIMVRIERNKDEIKLYWKKLSGYRGYEPVKLELQKVKELSSEEWDRFINLVNKIDFWNMKSNLGEIGVDGSDWILEGSTDDYFHAVIRWAPTGSEFSKCCIYLLGLTDLKFDKENPIY